ncbi:hypothetical protein COCON_G00227230 [Conger conger]|uniref:Uncharacterized protein n=1 Tax=Conger conger TaxID=82655 RepID=A0A9Q1HNZ4_CONCO|nr:hypothetical protein COCON_G00227230 [Conger conger]
MKEPASLWLFTLVCEAGEKLARWRDEPNTRGASQAGSEKPPGIFGWSSAETGMPVETAWACHRPGRRKGYSRLHWASGRDLKQRLRELEPADRPQSS